LAVYFSFWKDLVFQEANKLPVFTILARVNGIFLIFLVFPLASIFLLSQV
jgi:hypothetical protein